MDGARDISVSSGGQCAGRGTWQGGAECGAAAEQRGVYHGPGAPGGSTPVSAWGVDSSPAQPLLPMGLDAATALHAVANAAASGVSTDTARGCGNQPAAQPQVAGIGCAAARPAPTSANGSTGSVPRVAGRHERPLAQVVQGKAVAAARSSTISRRSAVLVQPPECNRLSVASPRASQLSGISTKPLGGAQSCEGKGGHGRVQLSDLGASASRPYARLLLD